MSESTTITIPATVPVPINDGILTPTLAPAPPVGDIAPADLPVSTTTALDRIKAKLAADKIASDKPLAFRFPVPQRPHVVVEYGPIVQSQWNGLLQVMLETKMETIDMQARALALFCRGVYLKDDISGELFSADLNAVTSAAPKMEERTAKALGIPWGGVQYEFVKALYRLDGDLLSTCAALLDVSGYGHSQEVAASAEGN